MQFALKQDVLVNDYLVIIKMCQIDVNNFYIEIITTFMSIMFSRISKHLYMEIMMYVIPLWWV